MDSKLFVCLLLFINGSICDLISPGIFLDAIYDLAVENPDKVLLESVKHDYIKQFQSRSNLMEVPQEDMAYFKIFPKYLGSVPPGEVLEFHNTTCFHNIKLSTEMISDTEVELTIEHREAESFLCHRSFVISTGSHVEVSEVFGNGRKTYKLTSDGTPWQDWDLLDRGPRVFVYLMTPETLTYNIGATAALFEPVLTEGVSGTFADMNREFLKAYAGIDMEPRDGFEVLDIPEELIKDGDTFDIMRLDGLDPMIAFAMGAATGHTGVALWRNGSLFICESNAKSAYWPVNGIQCNPYKDWVEYGHRNGYNVVWAPLDSQNGTRSLDNEKAWELVDKMYGVDYGYEVVLMGWLDTLYDNVPCMYDRDIGKMCLEPEHLELLFSYVQRVSQVAARVFVPAIQQRAGVAFDKTLLEAYFEASFSGLLPTEIFSQPEQDGWQYQMTRNGVPELSEAMICNVFVCNVWKAGGLFGDTEINCGETSVNDNYRLNIYQDPEERPEKCKKNDPENPNCQILGKYNLRLDSEPGVLPRYNYISITEHMFEKCPSQAPDYLAPQDC